MIELTDSRRATTNTFIAELCVINLNGLSVRKSLNILMEGIVMLVRARSSNEVITMKKSKIFQLSLK